MCKFKFLFFVLFILTVLTTLAQTKELPRYSFINYQENKIEYYGKANSYFERFYKKFQSPIKKGKGQVRILHLGDSHLQADFFTGRTRANFQTILPGLQGSRGMICPYKKGCPDSYKITYGPQWQHHNILSKDFNHNTIFANTISTTDSVANIEIEINFRNPIKYDFNRVRVYHSPLQERDNISIENHNYSKRYDERGYTIFELNKHTDKINITINKTTTDTLYVYGFYFDNGDAGVVYNATGVNSAEARNYERIFQNQILGSLNLDLIIISLGTNDCYEQSGVETFGNNMTKLINSIREQLPEVPILLTTPSDCWYKRKYINKRMLQARNIINEIAKQTNCAVWDWYEIMGGEGVSTKWQQQKLMQADKVHLTVNGYYLQGDMLYNALWEEIEKTIFSE